MKIFTKKNITMIFVLIGAIAGYRLVIGFAGKSNSRIGRTIAEYLG